MIKYFYGLNDNQVEDLAVDDIAILFYIINENINHLLEKMGNVGGNNEKTEIKKKSAFDDYDLENGYVDAQDELENNPYYIYRCNINYIIKYCISNCRMSVKDCYNSELDYLLDYIDFNMKYDEEHKNDE